MKNCYVQNKLPSEKVYCFEVCGCSRFDFRCRWRQCDVMCSDHRGCKWQFRWKRDFIIIVRCASIQQRTSNRSSPAMKGGERIVGRIQNRSCHWKFVLVICAYPLFWGNKHAQKYFRRPNISGQEADDPIWKGRKQ